MGESAKLTNVAEGGAAPSDGEAESTSGSVGFEGQMDRLSLEQALRDFEIANGRVIDLTRRLLEANDQIHDLKQHIENSRLRVILIKRPLTFLKLTFVGTAAKKARNALRSRKG